MKTIQERVEDHVSQFQVGDRIEAFMDDAEVDGEIINIEGKKAKIKTNWGNFTIDLSLAKKMPK